MCESSKLPMFTLLLLIMGSHASGCDLVTFVLGVTIIIELSLCCTVGTDVPLGEI